MELRTASSPRDVKTYDTKRLREEFLIDDLFKADDVKLVYSHIDRIITGSAVPVTAPLSLATGDELRAEYFLQRRELGVINIGGEGTVTVDGATAAGAMEYGLKYLAVMVWGFLPFALCNTYSSTLRETGVPVVPMAAGICAVTVSPDPTVRTVSVWFFNSFSASAQVIPVRSSKTICLPAASSSV